MLQSILNGDIKYIINKYIAENDLNTNVSVYDVELFGINIAICLGEIIDTYIEKKFTIVQYI